MFQFSVEKLEDIPRCYGFALAALGPLSEDASYAVKLVIDELCANVVEHSGCRAEVAFAAEGGVLRLTVTGNCGFCEKKLRPPGLFDERGRGVFLVRQFCREFRYLNGGRTAEAAISLE